MRREEVKSLECSYKESHRAFVAVKGAPVRGSGRSDVCTAEVVINEINNVLFNLVSGRTSSYPPRIAEASHFPGAE